MSEKITTEKVDGVMSRAKCLHEASVVEAAMDAMALKISDKLKTSNPVLLCVMIGGVVPTAMLMRRLNFPMQVDYIHATRYRDEFVGKELEWRVTPRVSLENRTVIIVDDILDGGVTLAGIMDYCHTQGAKEVFTAVLVEKKAARASGGLHEADFTAVTCEDRFVFGYGLDYKGYLRNAPGIYAVSREDL